MLIDPGGQGVEPLGRIVSARNRASDKPATSRWGLPLLLPGEGRGCSHKCARSERRAWRGAKRGASQPRMVGLRIGNWPFGFGRRRQVSQPTLKCGRSLSSRHIVPMSFGRTPGRCTRFGRLALAEHPGGAADRGSRSACTCAALGAAQANGVRRGGVREVEGVRAYDAGIWAASSRHLHTVRAVPGSAGVADS